MPIYEDNKRVGKVLVGTGAATAREIDHVYAPVSGHEFHEVFVRPSLPTITSFAVSPLSGTTGSLASTPHLTASYNVPGVVETVPGTPGTASSSTMTPGRIFTHNYGWMRAGNAFGWAPFGSLSIAPAGNVHGIIWNTGGGLSVIGAANAFRDLALNTVLGTLTVNGTDYGLQRGGNFGSLSATTSVTNNPFALTARPTVQIVFTSAAARAAGLPSGQTTVFFSPGTPSTTRTVFPTVEIHAGGTTYAVHSSNLPSGTVNIPTPSQDTVIRLDATNIEGTRSARQRFDFRTALSGLTITVVGYVPQTTLANQQQQPRIRFDWTGDPSSAYVIATGASPSRIDNLVNGSTHTFTINFQAAARDIVVQLLASGVNDQNQSVGLVQNHTLHIPPISG